MTSWREQASAQSQADLDGLLNVALGFAQQQLTEHGEFFPFAVGVTTAGEAEMIAARPDITDEQPRSADVIDACLDQLAARRGELRAAAVVSDVHLPDLNTDAIDVALEHAEGQALKLQLPYSKRQFRNNIEYGQLRAAPSSLRVWNQA